MIASGLYWETRSSAWGCRVMIALLKLYERCLDESVSRFSLVSNRSAAEKWKSNVRRLIWRLPDWWSPLRIVWKREMFRGVVITVALEPWVATSLAMSIMGTRWPGDMKGKREDTELIRSSYWYHCAGEPRGLLCREFCCEDCREFCLNLEEVHIIRKCKDTWYLMICSFVRKVLDLTKITGQ